MRLEQVGARELAGAANRLQQRRRALVVEVGSNDGRFLADLRDGQNDPADLPAMLAARDAVRRTDPEVLLVMGNIINWSL